MVLAAVLGFAGGVVASVVGVVALALFAGGFIDDVFLSTIPYGAGEPLAAVDLEPGQCADGLPEEVDRYDAASVVPCTAPHDVEHFASIQVPIDAGTPRPDEDDLSFLADDLCLTTFTAHTGEVWMDSELDYVALYPSTEAWQQGERGLHCVLVGPGPLPARAGA